MGQKLSVVGEHFKKTRSYEKAGSYMRDYAVLQCNYATGRRALFTSYPHGESLSSPRRPVSNVAQDSFDRQTVCTLLPALHACVMAAHRRIYSAAGKYGEDMDLCKDNDKCMDFIIM